MGPEKSLAQLSVMPPEQLEKFWFSAMPHGHRFRSFSYDSETCVAAIQRVAQHRGSRNRAYKVKVLGLALPDSCRSIDEARALAAQAYSAREV